ncbi:MAG: hypothetical protein WA738_14760 [Candidatus Angelobacter sp.]
MKYMKAMLLGAALTAGTTTLAVAQRVVPVQWGWGQRDNDDRQAYRDGLNQGQSDARHNRRFNPNNSRWRERDDREAYRSGYERGFQQYGGYSNDRDRDDDRDRDRGYGRGGYGSGGYGANAARQNGYQDGLNDGARDRRSGHSNRPTQDSNYKHADHGYSSTYGDKNYYKQGYRQAYENGYQQGYNSGGYRRY